MNNTELLNEPLAESDGTEFAAHSDSLYDFPLAAATVLQIPTSKIIPNPSQPRKVFADKSLRTLADSISRHGILQPLLVRQYGDIYELIAGERRLKAAVISGLEKVPCILRESDSVSSAEIAIIENLQREDLNMFEEAEAIQKLIESCGMTQENAALRLSCSQSYIANKLRLLKLPVLQRRAILECQLTERHARALLRIRNDDDRADVMAVIIQRRLNVAATEEYIENFLCQQERIASASKIARIEQDVKRKLLSKDMRLFYNSIDRAVNSVKECGFVVESTRRPAEGGTLISIFIKDRTQE